MTSRAAAKGRKLLLLAAVCLASALLLSPTAEASRSLPASAVDLTPPVRSWDAEAPPTPQLELFHLEDDLLVEILTGVKPEHHQALLDHRRLELLPSTSWAPAIHKTASGASTSGFELNVQKRKSLKPDLRWTVPFYAKARFYDPEVGRFLTEDPAEPDLTTPPSLHKYLYAYGNPTRYWDPLGLSNDQVAHRWKSEDDIPDGTVYVTYSGEYFDMNFASWSKGRMGDYEFVLNHATEWGYKKKSWLRRVWDSAWGFYKKRINGEGVVEDGYRLGVVFVDVEDERASRLDISDENLERVLQGGDQTGVTNLAGAAFRAGGTLASSALIVVDDVALLTGAGGLVKQGIKDGAKIIVKAADGTLTRLKVRNRRLVAEGAERGITRVDDAVQNRVVAESTEAGAKTADDAVSGVANRTLPVLHQDQLIIDNYQRYYNDAWERVAADFNAGKISIPAGMHWKTVLGQRVDAIARNRLKKYLSREGIPEGPGTDVLVNRWLRDPRGTGRYRIPDVRLEQTGTIPDGTIGSKTMTSPQVQDFVDFSEGHRVIIVRPETGPGLHP